MKPGVRWLGVVAESLIVLLSFAAAVFVRFGSLEGLLGIPRSSRRWCVCAVAVQLTLYYAEMYEYRSRRRFEIFQRFGPVRRGRGGGARGRVLRRPGARGRPRHLRVLRAVRLVRAVAVPAVPAVGLGHARGLRRPRADPGHRRPGAKNCPRDAEARADRVSRARLPHRARGRGGPHDRQPERARHARRTCRGSASRRAPR